MLPFISFIHNKGDICLIVWILAGSGQKAENTVLLLRPLKLQARAKQFFLSPLEVLNNLHIRILSR